MHPDQLAALLASAAGSELMALVSSGERLFAVDFHRLGAARGDRAAPETPQSIAIVPLQGALTPKGGHATFQGRMRAAAAAPDVGAIVIDAHTPGGTVAGTPESADLVRAVAAQKPVICLVDTCLASAGYYIGSQASQIWMTPSAEAGSIGVRGEHFDISALLANAGVKVTSIVSADSPYKAELSPFAPLSEEAADHVRGQADTEMAKFVSAVAAGRKVSPDTVKSSFGKGRMIGADQAVQLGMADKIGDMGDVLASLRTKRGAVRKRSAMAFA